MWTEEEWELSDKVYQLVKGIDGLEEMYTNSDGIHDSGRYTLNFTKDGDPYRGECELYSLSVGSIGVEVCIPADGRDKYELPDKIKEYFDQKLPGAKFRQVCGNVFAWEYDDPADFKKILG